jgi:thymidylate synthase ThyX
MSLSVDDRARVRAYCSNEDGNVFALYGLPEEVIAVLFAYYSRSKGTLRENLAKLLADDELAIDAGPTHGGGGHLGAAEKARAFHEKWVVGYGHSSVAEHACVHLAIEDVSILCAKAIEDLRLASYTEKSTRYVQFSADSCVIPPELEGALADEAKAATATLFSTYLGLFPRVEEGLRARIPRGEKQTERGYATAIFAQACDLLRGLLPAGTRTNLGFTANARALAMLLNKMLASPLGELRAVASSMHREALAIAPTLVKHIEPNAHRIAMRNDLSAAIGEAAIGGGMSIGNGVRLLHHDRDALARVALSLAFDLPSSNAGASAIAEHLSSAPTAKLVELVAASLAGRGKWDNFPRGFEASSSTFEVVMDYGAFRDLQRHRMMTQQVQRVGCDLGAEVPLELAELGVDGEFRRALDRAESAWRTIAPRAPEAAQYVVPLAYRVRALWTANLREIAHLIELRSARQGHASYRRIAQDLFHVVERAYPWLAPHIRVDRTDTHALARDVA